MKDDLRKLLDALGCEQYSEKHDLTGHKIICTCPMHVDSSPSFMIRPESFMFNCFVCGGGAGLINLVMRAKQLPYHKARRFVDKYIDLSQARLRGAFQEKQAPELVPITEVALSAYTQWPTIAEDYWSSRGFTDLTRRQHDVGFDRHRRRIIVPIRNKDERIVGFIGRTIRKGNKLRYLIYDDRPKDQMMLGIHHANFDAPLMVVEGSFDYLMVRQHGFRNVISILGSHASPWQLDQLSRAKKLLLFLDNDDAGVDGTLHLLSKLPDNRILVPCYSDKDKDPGGMTQERLVSLIRTVKPPFAKRLKPFD